MPRFFYKIVTATGEVIQGETEGTARASVIEKLRAEGRVPIRVDEIGSARRGRRRTGPRTVTGTLGQDDLVAVTRDLATLLGAGLSADRALATMIQTTATGQVHAFLRGLLEKVSGGMTLADAFRTSGARLPGFYVGIVRSGELGGQLETAFHRLAETLARTQALRQSVLSAMIYPAIVVGAAALSIIILLTFVVPEFEAIFEDTGSVPPASASVIFALSRGLRGYWWLMAGVAGMLFILATYLSGRPKARLAAHRMILRLPLSGDLVAKLETARFSRTLGALLGNGVVMTEALGIATVSIGNQVMARALTDIAQGLKRGEGLSLPLERAAVFPPLALQLIRVGEESGRLDTMLIKVADIYDEEVGRTLQRAVAILVPATTIVLGLIVAGIVGSMMTAILSAYDLPV